MRAGFWTLVSLALCAAAAGGALAHYAIDIVGDYALPRDTYDNLVNHSSRELLTGVALLVAAAIAARGLRVCCDIATLNRGRLVRPALRLRETLGFFSVAVAASVALVPGMEWLDGRIDNQPVTGVDDAFGGSILLGVGVAILCAGVVALLVYGLAHWLISHRDSIVTIIATLRRRLVGTSPPRCYALSAQLFTHRRKRTTPGLRLAKRGPPATSLA